MDGEYPKFVFALAIPDRASLRTCSLKDVVCDGGTSPWIALDPVEMNKLISWCLEAKSRHLEYTFYIYQYSPTTDTVYLRQTI